ncbi:MAG: SAM-dependent methyltransferase [Bacteroidales bacterium]|nr:SAM-dependent methyltransferase [Bacteroidales bacterium]
MSKKIEYGDFQTPLELAIEVVNLIDKIVGRPSMVIEPTCGIGNFIQAAHQVWGDSTQYNGYEINKNYYNLLIKIYKNNKNVTINLSDFFITDWEQILNTKELLIIGNPPWVTNSILSSLNSDNLPKKNNFQKYRGYDAKTGKANFDIAEWMIIKLIEAMQIGHHLALLCKTATARKVLFHFWKQNPIIAEAKIFHIDAKKSFNVNVDACLLFVKKINTSRFFAEAYNDLKHSNYAYRFGIKNNELISNIDNYEKYKFLDGFSNYKWRSGVKHDASKVMELTIKNEIYYNGFGEIADIEDSFVYPLLKSSDLGNNRRIPRKYVIVTQKNIGEDTNVISSEAPKTWNYLNHYSEILNNRKSSIYKNKPKYSIFGIGNYSFSQWKVAISGLYKAIHFMAIPPYKEKPMMVDDTCYFIPCHNEKEALIWEKLLNSKQCIDFLNSLIFYDAKRPITNDILKRINLGELASSKKMFVEVQKYLESPYELYSKEQRLLVFDKIAIDSTIDNSHIHSQINLEHGLILK